MITPERILVVVGALLSVLLQIVIAPQIAVFSILPNFMVVYAMLMAVMRAHSVGILLPFALGLSYDLLTGGPLGAMAFCLTLFSVASSLLFGAMDNDTRFVSLTVLAVGLLLVDASYGIAMLALGYNATFLQALLYRIVPSFIYDVVLAFVLFPLLSRLFGFGSRPAGGTAKIL